MKNFDVLDNLTKLKFAGKAEAFVEQKFLTPLLECLGYENHKDYEVYRHGDDGANFKLKYPPVENGAIKVKHYNPDYIPTIRKKIFWIIEAKSPTITYPFEYKYIIQGLQYCIHPEIQAKYLILSNGKNTSVYDAHSSIFFEQDIYAPIFEFENNELTKKWEEIYNLLGVEKIRTKIEKSIKDFYEKLSLSSLDEKYPEHLINFIGKEKYELAQKIRKNTAKLYVEKRDEEYTTTTQYLQSATLKELEIAMEYPLGRGSNNPSMYYVMKLLEIESEEQIYNILVTNYDRYSYFQKEHCYVALCTLHQKSSDQTMKKKIENFVNDHADEELSPLNKAESILLRVVRKMTMIHVHPTLRSKIDEQLKCAPEIVRFVEKPSVLNYTYSNELIIHDNYFGLLKQLSENELVLLIPNLEKLESILEADYQIAQKEQRDDEREIGGGFDVYGVGNKIWSLKNIAINYKISENTNGLN